MTTKLKVNGALVRVASTCMADCDIRYYLNGILIEPRAEGGAYLVGTDGHRMIAIIDPTAECSEPTIISPSRATLAALPKVGGKGDGFVDISLTEFATQPALLVSNSTTGEYLSAQVANAVVDGADKFPKWRKVLPDFSKLRQGVLGTVNAKYLRAPFDAFASTGRAPNTIQSWQDPALQDHNVTVHRINGRDDIVYLVMPMRDRGGSLKWVADWSTIKAQHKPKEDGK